MDAQLHIHIAATVLTTYSTLLELSFTRHVSSWIKTTLISITSTARSMYYEHLGQIFWKSENYLFHAFASLKNVFFVKVLPPACRLTGAIGGGTGIWWEGSQTLVNSR